MIDSADKRILVLLGRFPPPFDGQSLTTERYENLMASDFEVVRVNSSVESSAGPVEKFRSYYRTGLELREVLTAHPEATIVWQSISPQLSGHFRDFLTVLPHIRHHATIAVVHWGDYDRVFRTPLARWTAKRLADSVDKFVFLDENLSDACSQWLRSARRTEIPNCVDYETLCSESEVDAKRDAGIKDTFRVLYLSNMIESKGYLDVVRAASRFKHSDFAVQFEFVGSWYSAKAQLEFEELVDTESLQDIVHHHGPVQDRTQIKELHLSSHAFVLPSYYSTEAQPMSIIEALSAGTPVISTYHGGIPNMVRDGEEAFLVPSQSPQSIAEAIVKLNDPTTWLDMSLRARMRFLEKYHPDVVKKRWIELIDAVSQVEAPR